MVQCAVQAAEEDADVKPICLIRQVECGKADRHVSEVIFQPEQTEVLELAAQAFFANAKDGERNPARPTAMLELQILPRD
jgi:hypothetical protein